LPGSPSEKTFVIFFLSSFTSVLCPVFKDGKKEALLYLCVFSSFFTIVKTYGGQPAFCFASNLLFKNGRLNKKILVETVPFFIMAAAFAILTLITQNVSDHSLDNYSLSLLQRICVPF